MKGSPFKPAWWLRNPHLQTLWPTFSGRGRKKIPLRRERVELPDGDFVDLDWSSYGHRHPIVLILHGLEGSSHSPYAKGMLQRLNLWGWRSVVMHFRSCSGELNRLPRTYHSADTADLAGVIEFIREREPKTPIVALGFSMGGNVLLKWLGETGADNPLSAAIAVSVPFDIAKTVGRLETGFSRFYQWHLLTYLKRKMANKFGTQASPIALPPIANLRSLREFDDKITAPLHGFTNGADYYTQASCRQYLKNIKVPTLLLQAVDDPFMSADVIPQANELSPQVTLEVTQAGGHVGFIGGTFPWQPEYWLEERVPQFIKDYLPHRQTYTSWVAETVSE